MITVGIDIGSLSAKAVVMKDNEIICWRVILTGPDSVEAASKVTESALEGCGLSLQNVQYMVATGYGRVNVPFAQRHVTEISCQLAQSRT